ncbi:hypothetical protein Q5H92_12915 [Hymenobacter sp. M29]|uniref:Uncharacterized protein n=1 Tax=Hymenobacter mellowenesis TaxID=3063995 RepID=A0ABT9AE44_9BACT|nr:hypothetical protein [Hymenobacter sp. M29]MDO7847266.1 hypothetical protein [Hymenobacter sp. M29]
MALRFFFRQLARVARAHPHTVRWLAGGGVVWVGLCFALGYRLPAFDRHPDWRGFPALNNPHLVVEEIPDSIFGHRYSHRFPYPSEAATVVRRGTLAGMDPDSTMEITSGYVVRKGWLAGRDSAVDLEITDGLEFYDDYRRNLKNFRSLGFQVTENEFESDIHMHLWTGGNDPGRPSEPWSPGFYQLGYEYLQLNFGGETGFFKDRQSSMSTSLDGFYQYNHPTSRQDTLYLRYGPDNTNYRVYVSAQPQPRELEWAVTNNSPDEVQFTVRYALDSLPLTQAEQARFTQTHEVSPPVNTAGRVRGWGPVDHVSWHNGRWYRVFAVGSVNPIFGSDPRSRVEVIDLAAGVITYRLPSHSSQGLLRTPVLGRPPKWWSWGLKLSPPIMSTWLRGEGMYTVRWQGDRLADMFRPDRSVQEYDLAAPDRFTITVGPKLKPELSPWMSCKYAFRDLVGR